MKNIMSRTLSGDNVFKRIEEPTQAERVSKIKLERVSSLPRIDVDRPRTPSFSSIPYMTPKSSISGSSSQSKADQNYDSIPTPPNTKKLRMRSFLWIKPESTAVSSSSVVAQLIPVLIANIGALSSGLALGFSAILLPQIKQDNQLFPHGNGTDSVNISTTLYRPFTATTEQGSWVAGIFGLGAILGGLSASYVGNKHGRRVCLMLLTLVDLLSWILIASSQNLATMLAGRLLAGFAAAGYAPCIQIFVAEITEAQHRGWMSALTVPITCIGTLLMYVIGSWLPWHLAAASCTPVPVLLGIGMYFQYESPEWYFQKEEEKMAYAALERLRGKDTNIVAEVFQIQEHRRQNISHQLSFIQGLRVLFLEKKYYKPFFTLNALFLFMIFSGKFAIEFYSVSIFSQAGGSIDHYLSAVIIAAIQLVGSLLFIPLIRKMSRKILIVASSFVMAVALFLFGLYLYAHHEGKLAGLASATWLPLTCIVVYMVAAPLGLCSLPLLYLAEFFPSEMRSVLGGLTVSLSHLELFLLVKTFPNLELAIGGHGAFWIYAGSCILAIILTLYCIPETKDRSLIQVENKFARGKEYLVTPWATPLPSPSLGSVRKLQLQTMMFTQ